jgi:hypothetical protein
MFSTAQTLKLYFLWKEYLFSKHKFIKNLFIRFTPYEYSFIFTNIFCKGSFTILFFFFSQKKSRNGKNTSWVLFLFLKMVGVLQKVSKLFCDPFNPIPHLAMINFSMQTNQKDGSRYVYVWLSQSQNHISWSPLLTSSQDQSWSMDSSILFSYGYNPIPSLEFGSLLA